MKQRKISSIAIFLIGMGIMGCTSSEGYKIRGTIGDVQEGKVTLVTYNGKMCDTLSVAEIKDGKFEMQGSVPELTVGIMSVEGVFAQTVIYLEDKEYEVKLDPGNLGFSEISGGGDTQQLANKYLAIDINLSKAVAQVRDEYMVAIRNPESEHFLQLKGFVDSLQQAADVEKEAFLTQHADSYIALCELANRAERLPLDELKKRFKMFSLRIIKMVDSMPNTISGNAIAKQIVRSGTSPAANYRAACLGKSDKDFLNKLKMVEEELDETIHWLEIIGDSGMIKSEKLLDLSQEADELYRIIVSSIVTSKAHQLKQV